MGGLGRSHVREPFELPGVGRSDAQQAWTKSNGGQRAGVDLFVDLFAPDKPVFGQFRYRHVWFRMSLEVLQPHIAFDVD
jgi:hypothetical protein